MSVGRCVAALLLGLAAALPAAARPAGDDDAPVAVAIPAVQGRGGASPWQGRRVQLQGVVTQRLSRGFTLQDAAGDGDPATSDAIVVVGGRGRLPAVGDTVRVVGTVHEAAPGRGGEGARTRTELRRDGVVEPTGRAPLPPPVPLRLPDDAGRFEALEAMRVVLPAPLVVSDARVAGARGRLLVAAGATRPRAPTDRLPPGPQAAAQAEAERARQIVLDRPADAADGDVRAGDRVIGAVTGVLDAHGADTPSRWRVVAEAAPRFERPQPRPLQPPAVPGALRIGFANLHNWFTSLRDGGDCPPGGCRGARDLADWLQQRARLVAMLAALDADVLALAEIEHDDDGAALQALVDALNAAGEPGRYAAVPPLASPRESRDAIRVGLVYRPARVRPLGAPQQDSDPSHGRPPLAQRFAPQDARAGGPFTVVVAHLKSRRCDGDSDDADAADAGDGAGCHDRRRTRQAQALARFAQRAGAPDGAVLVLGDLNAHVQEAPLQRLRAAGFADLLDAGAYTYVHDGLAGRLDHALASRALAPRVQGAAVWHVNADEPAPANRRGRGANAGPAGASDHDPLIVGLGAAVPRRQGSQPTP